MTDAECERPGRHKKAGGGHLCRLPDVRANALICFSRVAALKRRASTEPVELRSIAYRHRWTNSYAALLGPLDSICFSVPTLTLICFGLASDFFGNVIFRTPLS